MISALSWLAVAYSVSLPFRAARAFAKSDQQHFCILSLFALVWAFLFPFWFDRQHYIFPVYSGFLLVFVGGLIRKANQPHPIAEVEPPKHLLAPTWMARISVLFFATGIVLSIRGITGDMPVTPQQCGLVLAVSLDCLGYLSIYDGFTTARPIWRKSLRFLTIIYSATEIAYVPAVWSICNSDEHSPWQFSLAMGLPEMTYATLVTLMILDRCYTTDDRELSTWERFLKLIGAGR